MERRLILNLLLFLIAITRYVQNTVELAECASAFNEWIDCSPGNDDEEGPSGEWGEKGEFLDEPIEDSRRELSAPPRVWVRVVLCASLRAPYLSSFKPLPLGLRRSVAQAILSNRSR
jgi:hypothetical protein